MEQPHGEPVVALSDLIRGRREQLGLNQEDLATRAHAALAEISPESVASLGALRVLIAKLEAAQKPPRQKVGRALATRDPRYRALARALDIEEEMFLAHVEEVQKRSEPEGDWPSSEQMDLLARETNSEYWRIARTDAVAREAASIALMHLKTVFDHANSEAALALWLRARPTALNTTRHDEQRRPTTDSEWIGAELQDFRPRLAEALSAAAVRVSVPYSVSIDLQRAILTVH